MCNPSFRHSRGSALWLGILIFLCLGFRVLFLPLRELEALPAEARGPLHGVPFGVKDNIDVAGFPTTAACEAFRHVPAATAPVVDQLLAAGAHGCSLHFLNLLLQLEFLLDYVSNFSNEIELVKESSKNFTTDPKFST